MSPPEIPPQLSRRSLLKTGLIGAVLVSAGGAGLLLQKARPQPHGELHVLDADEYAVLAAMCERMCPAQGQGAPGATELDLAGYIDRMLAPIDQETQQGVKIGLRLFDNALTGALFGERITPFTKLSPEKQDAVLEAWRDSGVAFRRTLFAGLAVLILSSYWGHESTWQRIGYSGPPDLQGLRRTYADNLVDLAALRSPSGPRGS